EVDFGNSVWLSAAVTQVPPWATVTSAALATSVFSPSDQTFELYEALRPWVDTTATWHAWNGVAFWQVEGGGGAADHGAAPVAKWVAPTTTNSTVPFNDAGVAMVQRWVETPAGNHGIAIENFRATTSTRFRESEYSVAAERPALVV